MNKRTETKWLIIEDFTPDDPKRKTRIFQVTNKEFGDYLGDIKWYGPWRKYCFFTKAILDHSKPVQFIFESTCLQDIAKVLNDLMINHRARREQIKNNAMAELQRPGVSLVDVMKVVLDKDEDE